MAGGILSGMTGNVAPPAGAWIETPGWRLALSAGQVAPPAGAWIETFSNGSRCTRASRRAPRGRVD